VTRIRIDKEIENLGTQQDIADKTTSDSETDNDVGQIDDSLVAHLLSLSHEQRLDAHESARELVRDLMEAGKDYYARQSQGAT
jgi:hypothetical protein